MKPSQHPFHRAHKPNAERVLVAFSGGLESAVAAALLRSQGYEPVALTLQLSDPKTAPLDGFSSRCCEGPSLDQSRALAEKLGLSWFKRNASDLFRDAVIDFCVHERLLGREPLPCLECNHAVLFRELFAAADEMGIKQVSTGHYAQVVPDPIQGGVRLTRAVDLDIDQSALLFRLQPEQLERLVLPLGGISANLVNKLAVEFGLTPNGAARSGSAGCFYRSANWREFVQARVAPSLREIGAIHSVNNAIIGDHTGLYLHRVGDPCPRLSMEESRNLVVVDSDHKQGVLVVGAPSYLERRYLYVAQLNWVSPISSVGLMRCQAQVGMDAQKAVGAGVIAFEGRNAIVELDEPVQNARSGGFVAFYARDELLGGAIIERTSMDPPQGLFVEKSKTNASIAAANQNE